jgi:hypothetical protein
VVVAAAFITPELLVRVEQVVVVMVGLEQILQELMALQILVVAAVALVGMTQG